MGANFNQTILAGNLTRDPESRQVGESTVASFGLAVNRRWRNRDGQQQEEATFVDCEAWGRTAELVAQYLSKGRSAMVVGRLKLDQWESQDGQKRSKLKVVADSVQFLDGPQGGPRVGGRESSPATDAPEASYGDDPPF